MIFRTVAGEDFAVVTGSGGKVVVPRADRSAVWSGEAAYSAGDVAWVGEDRYRCVADVPAGAAGSPNPGPAADAGHWEVWPVRLSVVDDLDAVRAGAALAADFSEWACTPAAYQGNPVTIVETASQTPGNKVFTPHAAGVAIVAHPADVPEGTQSLRWRASSGDIDLSAVRTKVYALGEQPGRLADGELFKDSTMGSSPSQAQLTEVVKRLFTALGGKLT